MMLQATVQNVMTSF